MMEVVPLPRNGAQDGPTKRHNVAEWSRMDHLTGMLEHARVETDHWASNTPSTKHQFGKVVDRRARNRRDGSVQQVEQTKQLEVFQAQTPAGSVQVIRSHTSSWSNTKQVGRPVSGWPSMNGTSNQFKSMDPLSIDQPLENLQLSSTPLDLSPQKMKVNIGRSGSIGGRRPPTRPRSIALKSSDNIAEETSSSRLSELSDICQQLHEETEKKLLGRTVHDKVKILSTSGKSLYQNGLSDNTDCSETSSKKSSSHSSTKLSKIFNSSSEISETLSNIKSHEKINRQKSSSIEDIKSLNLDAPDTNLRHASNECNWERASKVRRSLQFPMQVKSDDSENSLNEKSVHKIRHQLEIKQKGFREAPLKHWSNMSELEGIVHKIKKSIENDSVKESSDTIESSSRESSEPRTLLPAKKKDSFITVESLNEVRGRLKPLNLETTDTHVNDSDDGIVTESKSETPSTGNSKVKSFVYGMEVMLHKPKINGTGSLESRSSSKSSSSSSCRSEEWYNRRKSYGFEQVHNQNPENQRSLKEESKVESSTDSGICRSSEIVTATVTPKLTISKYDEVMPKSILDNPEGKHYVNQFSRKTTVTLGDSYNHSTKNLDSNFESHRRSFPGGKIQEALRSLRETSSTTNSFEQKRKSEPITISIPIVQVSSTTDQNISTKSKTFYHRKLSNGTAVSVESSIIIDDDKESCKESDSDVHSLSLNSISDKISGVSTEDLLSEQSDSSVKLSNQNDSTSSDLENDTNFAHPSKQIFSDEDTESSLMKSDSNYDQNGLNMSNEDTASEKKHRKVEFSKTEIHFAAEPGKLNIVETDGKPPPTNIYRRRRKTSKDYTNRSNFYEIRFGDSQYEKELLMANNSPNSDEQKISLTYKPVTIEEIRNVSPSLSETHNKIIDSFTQKYGTDYKYVCDPLIAYQVSSDCENPKLRSILKNHSTKPDNHSSEEKERGNEKLKNESELENDSKNVWHSSVDIKNTQTAPEDKDFSTFLKSLKPSSRNSIDIPELSRLHSSSIAADNGLEVRISSTNTSDKRRASWSVPEQNSAVEYSKLKGFSTKVNFGASETTVVGSPSQNIPVSGPTWFQSQSFCDNRLSNSKCQEKLIVRIGDGSNETTSCTKDLPKFSYNFNRFSAKKTASSEISSTKNTNPYQKICDSLPEFKSTSLVMETLRSPTVQSVSENERISTSVWNGKTNPTSWSATPPVRSPLKIVEPPSSNRNGATESPANDNNSIPSVLSVLDDLRKSIDQDITEIAKHKNKNVNANSIFRIKNVFKTSERGGSLFRNPKSNICDIRSGPRGQPSVPSQLSLLKQILDSGELSDDSLKADEEVRSYMSHTNDEDELSSEVSGSWSKVKAIKYNQRLNLANKVLTTHSGVASLKPLKYISNAVLLADNARFFNELSEWLPLFKAETEIVVHLNDCEKVLTITNTVVVINKDKNSPLVHRVVATTKVDSYDQPSNLQSVEALVSTKSGHPKITSISLKYEEDPTLPNFKPLNFSNRLSKSSAMAPEPLSAHVGKNSRTNSKPAGSVTSVKVKKLDQTVHQVSKSSHRNAENVYTSCNNDLEGRCVEIPILVEEVSNKTEKCSRELNVSEKKRSLNCVQPGKMSLKKSSTPPRKVGTLKRVESQEPRSLNRRSASPSNDKNSQSSSRGAKPVEKPHKDVKSQREQTEPLVFRIRRDRPDKAPANRPDASQRKAVQERKSLFDSGRDSWLNAPKDVSEQRRHCNYHSKNIATDTLKDKRSTESKKAKGDSSVGEPAKSRTRADSVETESSILEELTKAADEILKAVNGCTDDESFKMSSDDEQKKNPSEKRVFKPLSVITENPTKQLRTAERSEARSLRVANNSRLKKMSSDSSFESVSRSSKRSVEDRSKRRQARASQLAAKKELSKGGVASSSEDIESATENTAAVKVKRVVKKVKTQAVKTISSGNNPPSNLHKPRDRVYPKDYQEEDKKSSKSSFKEGGTEKTNCQSVARKVRPTEMTKQTDDLRFKSKSHSESQKESRKSTKGPGISQKSDSSGRKMVSSHRNHNYPSK